MFIVVDVLCCCWLLVVAVMVIVITVVVFEAIQEGEEGEQKWREREREKLAV